MQKVNNFSHKAENSEKLQVCFLIPSRDNRTKTSQVHVAS